MYARIYYMYVNSYCNKHFCMLRMFVNRYMICMHVSVYLYVYIYIYLFSIYLSI